jgi:HD-GYP domain-containing protein (c-di-GMP phosphodiesterase class II)
MKKIKLRLHVHLTVFFIMATLLISGIIVAVGYHMSHQMLESSAQDLTQRSTHIIASEIKSIIGPANTVVKLLSHHSITNVETLQQGMSSFKVLQVALQSDLGMSSLFIGYDTGEYLYLHRIGSEQERMRFNAPEKSLYQLRSIVHRHGKPQATYIYLDRDMKVLREEAHPEYTRFDPRQRSWYQMAIVTTDLITTQPYLFYSSGEVGMTIAKRAQNGRAVVAVDIPLSALGTALARQKVTPSSQLVLVGENGDVVAYEDLQKMIVPTTTSTGLPRLKHLDVFGVPALRGMIAYASRDMPAQGSARMVDIDGNDWRVSIQPISLAGADPLYLMAAIPSRELFATALKIRSTSLWVALLIILLAMPLIWLATRQISLSLRKLVDEADAIRHFEFAEPIRLQSRIIEVDRLAETMGVMKSTIRKFIDISHAVAAETNFDRLLPMLLRETMGAAEAQAGVLFLTDHLSDQDRLLPCAALNDKNDEVSTQFQPLALNGLPAAWKMAVEMQQAQTSELTAAEMRALGLELLCKDCIAGYIVAVPLFDRKQDLLGLMLLKRKTDIDAAQLAFVSALSHSASSSMETRSLIREQKQLFEAFIQMIAGAIDAKSEYTGGHCARVPVLTKMLAQAACDQKTGPYADFDLTADEWEAVHVASWLHDCGKVTTPEYVVDKATKLETIYDRLHEIRMRFEVLKRDAEIAYLQAIAAGESEQIARERLVQQHSQLDQDFAFVAACNEGGEFMAPEKIARLQQIAARTWMRTLDDRIGVSHDEIRRKQKQPQTALPARENLLADKAEHLIERGAHADIPAENQRGVSLKVPQLLYNRGELYNLSVSRGTLSAEERYKINEHIVQTIIMLNQLPFPRHLRQVPEIAGGHHEKMDGTGYPKGLTRDQMSPVARMMAIADIFEALTAADRPYKKGKTLSEALRIMSVMKKERHIDAELFELFLRSGIYKAYAARYMEPAQIDEIDIEAYLKN